ncbi:MAG: c-type cytochrome [Gammaproteobacteria bacterium]
MMKCLRILLATLCGLGLQAPNALAQNGATLYAQNCAACHGSHGNGGVGVPLALPDFQQSVSDQFLADTIRYGRPGRVMPAFKGLSDHEITLLVQHLRSWRPSAPPHAPVTVRPGDVQRGQQLFANHCSSCHGAKGEGGHGTGVTFSRPRDLPIIAPALNNSGFLASASDAMIKSTLIHGRQGTPMTSFIQQGLSEQDIDDLVSYVRSFAQAPHDQQVAMTGTEHTVIRYESPHDMQTTIENVQRAATGKNFRIIRVQQLEHGLVEEGKENPRQAIIYFCNFEFLNEALAVDPRVGLFLPCRITVIERQGKVEVLAINPKYLGRIFNNAELNKLCTQMDAMYQEIIEESTL